MTLSEKDRLRLEHMRDACGEIIGFTTGLNRAAYDTDRKLQLAISTLVLIIGEAASHVSDELRAAHPNINWSGIVGTRHRVVHGYDTINHDIVWQIVSTHVPQLSTDLESILAGM